MPRTPFGRQIIEVDREEEGVREEEEIIFGTWDVYIVWKLRKKRAEEGVD